MQNKSLHLPVFEQIHVLVAIASCSFWACFNASPNSLLLGAATSTFLAFFPPVHDAGELGLVVDVN